MSESAYLLQAYASVVSTGTQLLQMAQIARIYYLVASSLVELNQHRQAFAYVEAALRLEPQNSDARGLYSEVCQYFE